jgi:hypothetical protein
MVSGMAHANDESFVHAFAERYSAARAHLRREMDALGLFERDGWRIAESTRMVTGGLELVLRPVHRYREAPPGLECIVWIQGEGASIDAECKPGGRPPPLGRMSPAT